MKNKKSLNFFFVVIIVILGSAINRQFDFENLRFEKPALAIVYIITFAFAVYSLIKDYRKIPKDEN